MFERRLKVLLAGLIVFTVLLLLRAAQVQIVEGSDWAKKAEESLSRPQMLETTRGEILDYKGRRVAYDEPCIDAAVDFRAIERDPKWMEQQAISRIFARNRAQYRVADKAGRKRILDAELAALAGDLDRMWRLLAAESGKSPEDIEAVKSDIRQRVEMRRRVVWYRKYKLAMEAKEESDKQHEGVPWYRSWLLSKDPAPQLDSFGIEVEEQTQAHVIYTNVKPESYVRLQKQLDTLPGLVLRRGRARLYPYSSVASHVIGHLGPVDHGDLKRDPAGGNELLRYYPSDLIGRGGVEGLAERVLRGTRGKIERVAGRDEVVSRIDPVGGKDVRLTIDMELQAQIEQAFVKVQWKGTKPHNKHLVIEEHEMYGAAVVIDIPTGELRALVSAPTYDLNQYDQLYSMLSKDEINRPFLNRATQMALEPGSTVKPMVGIGAITQGLITCDHGVECTGYLHIDGRKMKLGRCWTASRFATQLGDAGVMHHPMPWYDPHPDGRLTFSDAVQRSCNPYFEALGDRMGLEGLSMWYERFGLGRRTYVGITEWPGQLPRAYRGPASERRGMSWFSAIGQGQVLATPLQMANVAATIARDGVWVRPRLVARPHVPTTRPSEPDRLHLGLSPAAVAAAKEGMWRVVNTKAGSGYDHIRRTDVNLAGKTGTAEARAFTVVKRDADGKPLKDEKNFTLRETFEVSTLTTPNEQMRWYRGSGQSGDALAHAWFIGFAPYENPTVAFCVMLEYGGSGGHDTAPVVKALLDACIEHGYLPAVKPTPSQQPPQPVQPPQPQPDPSGGVG